MNQGEGIMVPPYGLAMEGRGLCRGPSRPNRNNILNRRLRLVLVPAEVHEEDAQKKVPEDCIVE